MVGGSVGVSLGGRAAPDRARAKSVASLGIWAARRETVGACRVVSHCRRDTIKTQPFQ